MDHGSEAPRDFEGLKSLLTERHRALPKRLKQAAGFVFHHPDEVAFGTAALIAERADVQPSTLVRLAQALGYTGFSEMQQVFRARLKEGLPDYHKRLEALKAAGPNAHASVLLSGFTEAAIVSIERLRTTLEPERLDAAVDLLAKADTIYLLAARRVFPLTAYLAYAFAKMGVRCQLIGEGLGQLGAEQLAGARQNDAVLAISFTPYAPSTVDLVATFGGSGSAGAVDHQLGVFTAGAVVNCLARGRGSRLRRLPFAVGELHCGDDPCRRRGEKREGGPG